AKGASVQDALLEAVQLHADGLTDAATVIVDKVQDEISTLQGTMSATVETAAFKSVDVQRALQQQADGLSVAATNATERFKAAVSGLEASMGAAIAAATAKGESVQEALLGAVQLHADGL